MWPWGSLLDRQEAIDVAVGFLRAGLGVQRRNKRGLWRQTAGWSKLPRSIEAFEAKKTSSTPAVVPGAAPALAQAGVGGFFLGILNLEFWILPPWNQEVFSEPWTLNLESYPLGFKKSFWDFESWIVDLRFGEECILNAFFAKSKIQDPSFSQDLEKCNFWSPENAISCSVQNVKKRGYHIYIHTHTYI